MSGNTLVADGVRLLRARLPPGWTVSALPTGTGTAKADTFIRLVGPDRKSARVRVLAKTSFIPKAAVEHLATRDRGGDGSDVVLAPYLSPAVRERLTTAGASYMDLTGNIRLILTQPGLFIESVGAKTNPVRIERLGRTLRGATAGRIVRALLDTRQPPGVRDLALRTGSNPGYVSRLLAWMDREALVERRGRGQLVSVDWQRLLRRWADEAPMAPSKLAVLYLDQPEQAFDKLDLRQTDAGTNVLVIAPFDEGVFVGSRTLDGVTHVATSQAAADVLSSPGRGPAEGEELIAWMAAHEKAWRG